METLAYGYGLVEAPRADEAGIYQSDYSAGVVLAHDVTGAVRRVLARVPRGNPDGLAVDEAGGVWVALGDGGGIARFRPDGTLDLVLDVPASFVASLCFGGNDRRDLYVATADNTEEPARGGTLFRTRSEISGLISPPARV